MSLRSVVSAALRRLPPRVRLGLLHRLGRFAPWEEGFDFTPPRPATGELVGPPDFVGIGVQKAGTTWWYELLVAHPGVSARPDIHKERHFLSRFGTAGFGPDDIADYHGWFPRPPGTLAGEWTPDYLYYPWVAPLLARAAPEARLLLMLRDPVERFRSGLAHQLRHRTPTTAATVTEAVIRGFYAAGLVRWYEYFDPDRVLVLQYERCVEDPAGELARSYRFLGLDDGFRPRDLHRPVSRTVEDKIHLDEDARRRMVDTYAADVEAMLALVPDIDLSLWTNFSTRPTP